MACWEDRELVWLVLLLFDVEVVVLGLPVFLDIEEFVGEPTITGGDGDCVEFAGCTCAVVDDFGFAAKDICVWVCWDLACCCGGFLIDDDGVDAIVGGD